MIDNLLDLSYWHWFGLAIILLALEITAPLTFFLWLCLAAVATALTKLLLPEIDIATQLILFSIFCVLSLIAWWRFGYNAQEKETDSPHLNRRNEGFVGRLLSLSQAIENGVGKVTINDSQWKVSGPDLDIGTMVRVVEVEGSVLIVEAVETSAK